MCISRHDNTEWEYAIQSTRFDLGQTHRGPFSEAEARLWLQEWEDNLGRRDAWLLVRRAVSEWEVVE